MIIVAAALGIGAWTLAEYLIHRFDGHGMKGKTPFSAEHLAHHADPMYFAASWKKAIAALIATALVLGLSVPVAGWALGGSFSFGFVWMYTTYEVVHRRLHTHAPINRYARWARHHHLYHHHGNPALNHGVTSPIWDWVFGTLSTTDVVNVPIRRAPNWLCDPETGRVAAAYADDFAVVGRAPSGTGAQGRPSA